MSELILVADDDPDISGHLEMTLRREGYRVHVASDGSEVLDLARSMHPDLVLLDVEMPRVSGYEACRCLRADSATASTPIIMVTGRTATSSVVEGLEAGADDYLAKPYQTSELLARVRSVLRRAQHLRSSSPLTGLPGNERITTELEHLTRDGTPFALAYTDLDHFKAYNDHYGFLRGDSVIRFTAEIIEGATSALHQRPAFAGHVGGDDFVVVCAPGEVEALCERVIAQFDAGAPNLYDVEDAARGGFEVADRRGELRWFPLVTISIGVVTTEVRPLGSAAEASAAASEMKSFAKQQSHSNFVVDRRRG